VSINHSLDQCSTQSLQQLQQLFTSGNLTFRLEAPQQQLQLQLLPPPAPASDTAPSQYASARVSIAATPLARSPLTRTPLARSPSPNLGLEPEPPKYRMSRTAKTVEALWREWTVGLRGAPSIDMLDRQWSSQWRSGCRSKLQFYSLRLEVIKEIRCIAQAQRISEETAM